MNNIIKKALSKLNRIFRQKRGIGENLIFAGELLPMEKTFPQDVFIVGFPKSGNTLMQHIIAHLVYGLNSEVSRTMVNLIVPDVYASSHYFRINHVCFFKSHERPRPSYRRVIYMVRDGRESLLSYYHMMKGMGKDICLEDLYMGKIPIYGGLWHEHVNAWEANPYKADILFVKYEDLIENKLEILNRLCTFLGLRRTEQELKKVIEYTSFEFMKQLEKKDDWQKAKERKNFKQGNFVRKGATTSFKQEVPQYLLEMFENQSQNSFYDFSS